MRILLLGGTGLTGSVAARRLAESGHAVTVFHRGEHEPPLPDSIRHIHGDCARLPASLRDLAPDVVIHMMAMSQTDAAQFLDVLRGSAGRAVVISSGDVYAAYGKLMRLESGPPGTQPIDEDAPRWKYGERVWRPDRPGDPYDKALVEDTLFASSELPVTILRFPAVYGPFDRFHRFKAWLDKMAADPRELRVHDAFAQWRWTHGFSEDVAEAVVLAATDPRAAGRTYNVGEPRAITWAERLEEWGRLAGWHGTVVPVPATELPADPWSKSDFSHHIDMDTTRIRQELGYQEVVPREEGIARTIAWERNVR